MKLALISLLPFLMAVIAPTTTRIRVSRIPLTWIVTGLTGLLFFYLLTYLPTVTAGQVVQASLAWVPALGLTLSLYLDGLALLFALIIVGIGTVVALYTGYYLEDTRELNRFYGLLFAFMGAMLGLVLAGNLLTMFIAWELTSILSFLLISFHGDTSAEARAGALRALIITGGGGLALLLGLALLTSAAGTSEFGQIVANPTLRDHPWYTAFTLLIFMGCFTKSAQFPFHFWLPGAMSAPTPASAYLHSATMVKAGIYLLLRLYPVLGGTPLWENGLMIVGLATLLIGAVLALRQYDLKAALAYSTISWLGALVALIGLPDGAGLQAALIGILAHSLYKATLFLTAGAVDHAAGTRDLRKLGGLAEAMPGWAVICLLAVLSMAGLPPLLGFVAKENLLDAMLEHPLALAVVVISAALTVALACILFWDVFWSQRHDTHPLHDLPMPLMVGPGVLAGGALLAGLGLQWLITPVIQPALTRAAHLTLFSGINTPFLLSLTAIAGGALIFVTRERWRGWMLPLPSGAQIYSGIVSGVEKAGDLVLKSQNGKLTRYLLVILGAVVLLEIPAGLAHVSGLNWVWQPETDLLRGVLVIVALTAMVGSILIKRHLTAALILGVAGYSVGGLFLLEPAPDVALVQFMVETLGTVLLIVMLRKIGAPERQAAMHNLWNQSRLSLVRDVVLSVLIGGGVGLFALAAVSNRPAQPPITLWHIENALNLLGFPDIVGAIVTDFRGMDTIIEISVFSVAALGVLTLLAKPVAGKEWPHRLIRPLHPHHEAGEKVTITEVAVEDGDVTELTEDSHFSTPLTRTIAQLMLPLAFIIALSQLFYGGDGPGDGFTAGVISGLGVALWYIVFGYHEAQQRLGWLKPRYLIGAGLTLVIGNAILSMVLGTPFLHHLNFDQIVLPANIHLSTTQFYETGIFLTVLGSSSTIMEAITYPKEIEPL
ncbi:MAG TPA: hydrogen gas-evolving membrane-bound hydrogenase subunit E [Phototrophicaceae bacterium]|nr:hydrogen gas-evolving membrane-bound hydrogenase subunit E [Phototrophicaceae bacterium]